MAGEGDEIGAAIAACEGMHVGAGGPDVLPAYEESDAEMLASLLREALPEEPKNGWDEWRERVRLALNIVAEESDDGQ